MTSSPIHPYAVLAGGPHTDEVHRMDNVVPRPSYLYLGRAPYSVLRRASAAVSPPCSASRSSSTDLHFELYGHGPKKMLLHMGLAATHAQWEPQFVHFGIERADEFTVCVFDTRGLGFSDAPQGRWRTTDLADDCVALMDHLASLDPELGDAAVDVDGSPHALRGAGPAWGSRSTGGTGVHIAGFSMGGMVALELALRCPDRLASLTLISTHAGGIRGTLPPLHGLARFVACFSSLGGAGAVDAGLDILFPASFLDREAKSIGGEDESTAKAAAGVDNTQMWRPVEATAAVVDPSYASSSSALSAPAVRTDTVRYACARSLILRARKFVEEGVYPEVNLGGVAKMIGAVLTHYVSWRRLRCLRRACREREIPVFVVSGELDNLVHHSNGKMLARELNGEHLVFPDGGHGVNEQYATAVNEGIQRTVDKGHASWCDHGSNTHFFQTTPPPPGMHPWAVFMMTFAVARGFAALAERRRTSTLPLSRWVRWMRTGAPLLLGLAMASLRSGGARLI